MDVFIIVLNYNNPKDTIDCIKSVQSVALKSRYKYHIVLIDNGSTDNSIEMFEKYLDDILLLKSGENLGYAAGNNIGIKEAIAKKSDYIIILNNDTIANDFSFDPCLDAMQRNSDIGISGPVILNYESEIIQSAGANVDYFKLRTPLLNAGIVYSKSNKIEYCDYVGGACLVIKTNDVSEVGFMPEDYFLFWEEVEWCKKITLHGKKCACIHEACIEHKGSATINSIAGLSRYYMERNRVVFAKRNSSLGIKCLSILRLYIVAITKGLFKDKKYFDFLGYYTEGLIKR